MNDQKTELFGSTLSELQTLAEASGQPVFRASQLADWLYKKHVFNPGDMSNLPIVWREVLTRNHPPAICTLLEVCKSADGTKKYLIETADGGKVEAAVIPDRDRKTLCLSTQVGCRRACAFCATGQQKWAGNCSTGDILRQYALLPERDEITNIVYMGMGEPFDNTEAVLRSLEVFTAEWGYAMSPYRFTVSTVGIRPGVNQFLGETRCHLAISLHNAISEERAQLVPAEKKFPVRELIDELRFYDFGHQRRLTFEYIMLADVNDQLRHAKALVKLLRDMRCRVNLIRYNTTGTEYACSDEATVLAFQRILKQGGLLAHIRKSKGQDIDAACGMLSTKIS